MVARIKTVSGSNESGSYTLYYAVKGLDGSWYAVHTKCPTIAVAQALYDALMQCPDTIEVRQSRP